MGTEPKEDSFAALFERQSQAQPAQRRRPRALRVGDKIEAIVVRVGKDSVFVELDDKQQAFIDTAELGGESGEVEVKEGDTLSARVVEIDLAQGLVRLGRSLGKPGSAAAIEQAKASQIPVEGKVTGVNKGGLEVDLGGGTRAFCPNSQADAKFVEDPKELIGQSLRFLVTDVRDGGKSVVVSRRALLQREASEAAEASASSIVAGATVRGTVTAVRDFGAFVDLGGIEGLIPRSEVTHDRSASIAASLSPGDVVEVQVLEVKDVKPAKPGGATRKVTLSLKALADDPWAKLDLVEGRVVVGTVTRVTEFGRFVRIAPAVDGLVHVSELGKKTAEAEVGQELTVVVKKIDRGAKKISLVPAPDGAVPGTTVVETRIAIGAVVSGKVERIETYGVFVQIDGTKGRAGRGLVPSAELGVARGTDLRRAFPEGTAVTAKVLETGDGRLRLSIKGAKDAEERADFEQARGKAQAPASLGTFADLLKKRR